MQMNPFQVTLTESFMITPKVKHFIFQCDLTPSLSFIAGQFITIHFEHQGKALKRSYSLANQPLHNNIVEFAAGYVANGPGTELLFTLKPGDTINISGPYGRLTLKEEDPLRYLLVATSTGITPYRAMLKNLATRLSNNANLQVVILQGVQKSEEVLYRDEFMQFQTQFPNQVIFRPYLSKVALGELSDNEYSGYVQSAFIDLNLNPEQDIIYLCGNPGMIDDSFNYLKEHGFSTQHIIREKYISR